MTAQVKPLGDISLRKFQDAAEQGNRLWSLTDVRELLATISDLQEKLRVASAREAAQHNAIIKHAVVNRFRADSADVLTCRHCGAEDFFYGEDEEFEKLKHKSDCITQNASPAAQALLDELAGYKQSLEKMTEYHDAEQEKRLALEANARTPGTVEVCERHALDECKDYPGKHERPQDCNVFGCPIRKPVG